MLRSTAILFSIDDTASRILGSRRSLLYQPVYRGVKPVTDYLLTPSYSAQPSPTIQPCALLCLE